MVCISNGLVQLTSIIRVQIDELGFCNEKISAKLLTQLA